MKRVNEASNWVSSVAHQSRLANRIPLHHAVYRELRERFGLSASYACTVITRVCNAYKSRPKKKRFEKLCKFRELSGIDLHPSLISFKGTTQVSLSTLRGRMVIPVTFGREFPYKVKFIRKSARLIYRKDLNAFFISVFVDVPEEPPITPEGWLGVDVGIANIAADSLGNLYGGDEVIKKREHFKGLRKALQKKKSKRRKQRKSTRSVRRALKRVSRREKNFVRVTLHTIAKQIVATAKALSLGIALEDLKGARGRIPLKVRKQKRYQHASWAYRQLQFFIAYKAALSGVPVAFVDARGTSRTCPECGFMDKKNRSSQAKFLCGKCGYTGHADIVAACNLALRAWAANPQPQMLVGDYSVRGSASAGKLSPA